jgi:hypothetical protein
MQEFRHNIHHNFTFILHTYFNILSFFSQSFTPLRLSVFSTQDANDDDGGCAKFLIKNNVVDDNVGDHKNQERSHDDKMKNHLYFTIDRFSSPFFFFLPKSRPPP